MPKNLRKIVCIGLLTAFTATSLNIPQVYAGELVMPIMPPPGSMVDLSPAFTPAQLQGIVVHPDNALKFDFIIDKGEGNLTQEQKQQEYKRLVKYFLASLAVPDKDQWVNLSPYEKDRIIAEDFGKTEMGRDLLAQDYLLKQITSSLIYPEKGLGKIFWDKVYTKAYAEFGNTNVPVNTFNKVWIVPDKAVIYEKGNTAYVLEHHLKVMLEEDYLAVEKNGCRPGDTFSGRCPQAGGQANGPLNVKAPQGNPLTTTQQVIREIILPELEREVNQGKNFALLRQVYSGMLLAAWYKRALKESLLSKVYADKSKVKGVDQPACRQAGTCEENDAIYQQYLQAFKKGVYNYIKEDVDQHTQQIIPRKYFSGGTVTPGMVYNGIVTEKDFLVPAETKALVQRLEGSDLAMISLQEQAQVESNVGNGQRVAEAVVREVAAAARGYFTSWKGTDRAMTQTKSFTQEQLVELDRLMREGKLDIVTAGISQKSKPLPFDVLKDMVERVLDFSPDPQAKGYVDDVQDVTDMNGLDKLLRRARQEVEGLDDIVEIVRQQTHIDAAMTTTSLDRRKFMLSGAAAVGAAVLGGAGTAYGGVTSEMRGLTLEADHDGAIRTLERYKTEKKIDPAHIDNLIKIIKSWPREMHWLIIQSKQNDSSTKLDIRPAERTVKVGITDTNEIQTTVIGTRKILEGVAASRNVLKELNPALDSLMQREKLKPADEGSKYMLMVPFIMHADGKSSLGQPSVVRPTAPSVDRAEVSHWFRNMVNDPESTRLRLERWAPYFKEAGTGSPSDAVPEELEYPLDIMTQLAPSLAAQIKNKIRTVEDLEEFLNYLRKSGLTKEDYYRATEEIFLIEINRLPAAKTDPAMLTPSRRKFLALLAGAGAVTMLSRDRSPERATQRFDTAKAQTWLRKQIAPNGLVNSFVGLPENDFSFGVSWMYNQGQAIQEFLALGDVKTAEELARAALRVKGPQKSWASAYTLAQGTVATNLPEQRASIIGPNAVMGHAMLNLLEMTDDPQLAQDLLKASIGLGEWFNGLFQDRNSYGFVITQEGSPKATTEHNLRTAAFYYQFYNQSRDAGHKFRSLFAQNAAGIEQLGLAAHAQKSIEWVQNKMWDKANKRYNVGYSDFKTETLVTDDNDQWSYTQFIAPLMANIAGLDPKDFAGGMDWVMANLSTFTAADGVTYKGVSRWHKTSSLWGKGVAETIVTLQLLGRQAEAGELFKTLKFLQSEDGGVKEAVGEGRQWPTNFPYSSIEAVMPAIMAELNQDPKFMADINARATRDAAMTPELEQAQEEYKTAILNYAALGERLSRSSRRDGFDNYRKTYEAQVKDHMAELNEKRIALAEAAAASGLKSSSAIKRLFWSPSSTSKAAQALLQGEVVQIDEAIGDALSGPGAMDVLTLANAKNNYRNALMAHMSNSVHLLSGSFETSQQAMEGLKLARAELIGDAIRGGLTSEAAILKVFSEATLGLPMTVHRVREEVEVVKQEVREALKKGLDINDKVDQVTRDLKKASNIGQVNGIIKDFEGYLRQREFKEELGPNSRLAAQINDALLPRFYFLREPVDEMVLSVHRVTKNEAYSNGITDLDVFYTKSDPLFAQRAALKSMPVQLLVDRKGLIIHEDMIRYLASTYEDFFNFDLRVLSSKGIQTRLMKFKSAVFKKVFQRPADIEPALLSYYLDFGLEIQREVHEKEEGELPESVDSVYLAPLFRSKDPLKVLGLIINFAAYDIHSDGLNPNMKILFNLFQFGKYFKADPQATAATNITDNQIDEIIEFFTNDLLQRPNAGEDLRQWARQYYAQLTQEEPGPEFNLLDKPRPEKVRAPRAQVERKDRTQRRSDRHRQQARVVQAPPAAAEQPKAVDLQENLMPADLEPVRANLPLAFDEDLETAIRAERSYLGALDTIADLIYTPQVSASVLASRGKISGDRLLIEALIDQEREHIPMLAGQTFREYFDGIVNAAGSQTPQASSGEEPAEVKEEELPPVYIVNKIKNIDRGRQREVTAKIREFYKRLKSGRVSPVSPRATGLYEENLQDHWGLFIQYSPEANQLAVVALGPKQGLRERTVNEYAGSTAGWAKDGNFREMDWSMVAAKTPGGIDLNAAHLNLQIKRDGKGVPLPLAQQDMAQLSAIQGFVPQIIEIKPAATLPIVGQLKQEIGI